ncbi:MULTISPECIES: gliding motility-associated C-terminal domain-containing protein [unclassified Flavobacterium]|uniref:gliding motility-associated C-terminal domain-containing protein n=1 Tax=unclassified Flavobacterium TaxID=196869 RepID=UPI0025BF29AA|nr:MULTISPECIES: gliding motility-associated C-terminal domain-containing protein [unclassified Flavobacterium]
MKKIYLLGVLFLSIFSFDSFANGVEINNASYNLKASIPTYRVNPNPEAHYKVNLTVANPTSSPTASSTSICEGSSLTLTANPAGGVAPYTFSWTGPNNYASTAENPVINNITQSNAGTYSLVVTDANGATSIAQSTAAVVVNVKVDPTFDAILPAICSGGSAPVLSTLSSNGITGTWNPSVVSNTATATYLFTPDANQCANSVPLTIYVIKNVTPTFTLPASICQGATSPVLSNTSNDGIVGTWNPSTVSNTSSGSYIFTPSAAQCATTVTINIIVNPVVTPTFEPISPICENATAPTLPTTSTNGITGTWNPAVSNTASGTYTFTPSAGQCATTTTLTVTVNPNITPTFATIAPICSGAPSPVLPSTSNNSFTGTWSPALVSNTATATYTFTPDAGQCATTTTLTVTVNPNITPTFAAIAPICSGATSPVLPSTSNNSFTGTWSPALVSNTATGTYTFTPSAGQCATTTTLTVTVNPNITPTFTAIAPICSGAPSPVLPSTSNNSFTGTWSPALVSNTATGTYTFTPDAGQCATTTTLTVTVNPNIVPTFTAIAPICSGATSPVLPSTSNNSFTGTWSPALVSNTATGTYTFTPSAGQCATTTTLTVTVNPNITPTFTAIAPICSGTTSPVLPSTSNNSFTGTWSPALVSNTATGTYTFTPDAGQCATTTTLTVTVNPNITPTFTAIAPICSGMPSPVLPSTSNNSFTGTWNPALVSNTATGTYTFTPDAGQCATTTTLTVTVNPNIIPTFSAIAPICANDTAPALSATSNNSFTGTWSPALVSNTATGTYTFTPDAGQCATTTTLTVTVNPNITPTFTAIAPICSGATSPVLPSTSNNSFTGNWSPALVSNTATGTYTFTPDAGQCATTITVTITVNPNIVPTFTAVAPICSGATSPVLPSTSNNSFTGTWSPALVSNTATGTYTFTPDAGQCATTTTLTVTVNPNTTPTFTAVAPICSGAPSPVLPLTSNNSFTGTWSPVLVSNTATATYAFTPDAGQCTTTTTLTVTVTPNTIPSFDPIADVCYGTAAPSLPTTSINGFTGTWNPATVSNTASAIYTFTPDAGSCATTATLSVNVTIITPSFNPIAPICANTTAPNLQSTSNNGITGSWNPATIDNTATGTYTFTPDSGQCAPTTTLTVTVNPFVAASFTAIAPICFGSTSPVLPLTSNNGYTGTWNPATVSNTANGTYTFTPNAGQCTFTTTLDVTVVPNVPPTFTAIAPICSGATRPVLPTTSINGVTGTWSPAVVSNTASGTYTFNPSVGLCALTTTLSITVYQSPTAIALTTTDVVNDGPDGIIEINGVTSGLSPYQYSINNSSFTTNTTYSNLLPGDYTITVKDSNGCEFSKVATINSICMFPNAISPNGDSYNDSFNLKGCDIVKLELFNRYGKKVNSYNNYTDQWDGTTSGGEALPDGTYFYVAEIKGGVSKSGWVFIVR